MFHFGLTGFTVFGLSALIFAGLHECWWFTRRHDRLVIGYVIGADFSDGEIYYPIVEYTINGTASTFTSKYGSSRKPKIGKEVTVSCPIGQSRPEIKSIGNRLIFTVVPLIFGLLFIAVGFAMQPIQ